MPKKKQKKVKKTTQKRKKKIHPVKSAKGGPSPLRKGGVFNRVKIKTMGKPLLEKSLIEPSEKRLIKPLMLDIIVNKKCPICKGALLSTILCNTEVDYCPKCLGLWFEEEELRWAKDEKDKDLRWLDIDIWKDTKNFKVAYGIRICPSCRVPLYEIYYGKSPVIVDVCNLCYGIWLDRGESKKIISWLKEKADYEILHNYSKNLFKETAEIFTGPETLREEILDFLTLLKLLNYKFVAQYPLISQLILKLPK